METEIRKIHLNYGVRERSREQVDIVLGLAGSVGLGGGRKALQAERTAGVITGREIQLVGGTGSLVCV